MQRKYPFPLVRNDCAIRALAELGGMPYAEVLRTAMRHRLFVPSVGLPLDNAPRLCAHLGLDLVVTAPLSMHRGIDTVLREERPKIAVFVDYVLYNCHAVIVDEDGISDLDREVCKHLEMDYVYVEYRVQGRRLARDSQDHRPMVAKTPKTILLGNDDVTGSKRPIAGAGYFESMHIAAEALNEPYNPVEDIIAYENGDMDADEMVQFHARLLKTGLIYGLQGHYHRNVQQLIDNGFISRTGEVLRLPSEE